MHNEKNEKNEIFKFLSFSLFSGVLIFFIKVFNKRTDFPAYYISGSRFIKKENLYVLADASPPLVVWPFRLF